MFRLIWNEKGTITEPGFRLSAAIKAFRCKCTRHLQIFMDQNISDVKIRGTPQLSSHFRFVDVECIVSALSALIVAESEPWPERLRNSVVFVTRTHTMRGKDSHRVKMAA